MTPEAASQPRDPSHAHDADGHLLDLGNLQEIALWILAAAGSGVVGSATYDLLKAMRHRYGSQRIDELKERVYQELKEVRDKRHLPARDLRNRVEETFNDFDA